MIPFASNAQRANWRHFRYEVSFGAGASNFLGDLGGANQIGTHFFKDLEFSLTRWVFDVSMRYKVSEFIAVKTNLMYGRVKGDDRLTEEFYRHHRNLSFRSDIFEASAYLEASFMREQGSHRYHIRNVRGQKGYEIYTYGFIGLGGFHFNPEARYQGKWYELQPLGTEGQGIDPAKNKYHRFQLTIPVGIGIKYSLDERYGIGMEFGVRRTFTDYIDDVSTNYFEGDQLQNKHGDIAKILADRSTYPASYEGRVNAPGEQRGNPNFTDAYMFLIFNLNYKLRTTRGNLPKL